MVTYSLFVYSVSAEVADVDKRIIRACAKKGAWHFQESLLLDSESGPGHKAAIAGEIMTDCASVTCERIPHALLF